MQLTDEPDKRCYPLDDHLYCQMCHIKRLSLEYPNEQFYIDPYTSNILNKTTGNQRDSISIMPAAMSSYPQNAPAPKNLNSSGTAGNGGTPRNVTMNGATFSPPPPIPSSSGMEAPPPLPPHRKITTNGMNGYDSAKKAYPKAMPQAPPNGMKYTITDL